MARAKSELLSGAGTAFEIVKAIVNAVRDEGGSDEDVRRILSDKKLRDDLAKRIVGKATTGAVTLSIQDFKFLPFLKDGEDYVAGDRIVVRAKTFEGSEPGPVEVRWLLDNQDQISAELRGKCLLITGCRPPDGSRGYAYLFWEDGRWVLRWNHLVTSYWGAGTLVVRLTRK